MQTDRAAWGTSVVANRGAARVLARAVRKLRSGLVAISTATDPYQHVEGRYRITRRALEVLLRADWPVSVLTRSPSSCGTLTCSSGSGRSRSACRSRPWTTGRALLEPWAPPIEARLRCLRDLADAGLTTFVGFAPAYPPTGGWTPDGVAEAFARAGVKEVFTRHLDARWGVRDAILARLEGSDLAPELLRLSDRRYMDRVVGSVAEACRSRGIEFRGDEGVPTRPARSA